VRDIVFLHAARSVSGVIFRDELRALEERHAGLRVVLRLGDAPDRGPLDEAKLRAEVPDFAERETFVCGPSGMMDTVERVFARVGATERLRSERFVAVPRARPVEAAAEPVTLRLSRSGRSIVASAGTLLEQLERAGERPEYGCRLGICNTCRCRKRSGTVENTVTGAISSEPDDEIRLCVSVARSDLDIEI